MPERLEPLFARVLLQRKKAEKIGSIIIPSEASQRHATLRCIVLAVGPTADKSIQVGDTVLIAQHSGAWISREGKVGAFAADDEWFVTQDEDILAIVREEKTNARAA